MSIFIETSQSEYGTLQHKNLESALSSFFKHEFPNLSGSIARRSLVQALVGLVHQYFPETSHVGPGQMSWVAVGKEAKGSYGAKIEDTPMVSVILPVTTPEEISSLAKREKGIRQARNESYVRLCDEAFRQGGVLTLADVAVITKTSTATVSKHIRAYEKLTGKTVPRRGTIHDMGPTLTHKGLIIPKLFLEKKSFQQVSRETWHSIPAIHRYYSAFKQVLTCAEKELSESEIMLATRMSRGLVRQYLNIIEDFKSKGCFPKELIALQPKIESDYEQHLKDQMKP